MRVFYFVVYCFDRVHAFYWNAFIFVVARIVNVLGTAYEKVLRNYQTEARFAISREAKAITDAKHQ